MNNFLKKFFSIAMLASSAAALADCSTDCNTSTSCSTSSSCGTVACYPVRSQSFQKFRYDAGMVGHTHDIGYDKEEGWWGTFFVTPGYQQSWRSSKIAEALLGSSFVSTTTTTMRSCDSSCEGSKTILIQGSAVAGRNASAWEAENFYLPTDFNGSFRIKPSIKTFTADLSFYLGLDEWWKGAYLQVYGPIVYTRADLDYEEQTPTSAGVNNYAAGYFTPNSFPRSNMLANFSAYIQGNAPATDARVDAAGIAHSVTFQPLNYARMACDSRHETGFGDLRAEFGWNFWRHEDYHMGINIQAAAPTGNKCCSKFLFDAVVGNGKHWELGGGLTGHYVFYRSEDGDKHFGFYGDLNVTHVFKRSGHHTYDLKGKPNSKYMLAAQYGPNNSAVRGTSATTGTLATQQFAENYSPVANLTTVNVDVSSSAQIDLVAKFNYTYKGFSIDLGYDFYFRSCQDVDCASDCDSCGDSMVNLCTVGQANTWSLKGDAQMYGFAASDATATAAPIVIASQAIPLSATEYKATINGGTNAPTAVLTLPTSNPTIDNPQQAYAGGTTPVRLGSAVVTTATLAANPINTSIPPVFLSCSDIDTRGTKSMSHTLFTHLQYNFDREDWRPYIGVGANVEFGTHSNDCDSSDCSDSCSTCSASFWGVWVKGGVSFS